MGRPGSIADLERLEGELEETAIDLIDKATNDATIADLQQHKLHLIDEIERLRGQSPKE